MTIKREDKDEQGENVQIQYYLNINNNVPVSVTCFHTTNNILLQLRSSGNKKNNNTAVEKSNQTQLKNFVNNNFKSLIEQVERSVHYQSMKLELDAVLNDLKESLELDQQAKKLNQQSNTPSRDTHPQCEKSTWSGNMDRALENGVMSPIAVSKSPPVSPISSPKRRGKRCNEECEKSTTGLKLRVSSLEKDKISLKQKVEMAEKHLESLRSTISSKDGLITTQTQVIDEQLKTINSQKKLIADQEVRSKTHSEFASSFLDIMVAEGDSELETEMSNNGNLLKQMHEKVKNLEEQVSTYETKLAEEEKARDLFQEKIDDAKKKLESKCRQYNALKTQLTSIEETVLLQEKDLKAAQDDKAETQGRIESLIIENDKNKEMITWLGEKNSNLIELSNESSSHSSPDQMTLEILEKSKEKDCEIVQLKETVDFTEKSAEDAKAKWKEA